MTEHHKAIRQAGLRVGFALQEAAQPERVRPSSTRLVELREWLRNRRPMIDKSMEESA